MNRESRQQDTNKITDTPNIEKLEHSNRNEQQTNYNENTTPDRKICEYNKNK